MAVGIRKRDKEDSPQKPTRYYSSKQEQKVAKTIGGKTTANSGATMFSGKGDILTQCFLIECKTKTTHSDSITIKKEWFDKNKEEMVFEGKEHQVIAFNFGPNEEMHYIIDEYLFQTLLDYIQDKEIK